MSSKPTALFRLWMLALLAGRAALGQPAGPLAGSATRAVTPAAAVAGALTVTILAAAAGALVQSQGAGNASLDLGVVSYFKGTSASGETSQKNSGSFVISTRFAIRVDCPGSPALAQVSVTMSRLDAAPSHTISIDGAALGSAPQTLDAIHALRLHRRAPPGCLSPRFDTGWIDWEQRRVPGHAQKITR